MDRADDRSTLDRDELLARVELLEAEVARLRADRQQAVTAPRGGQRTDRRGLLRGLVASGAAAVALAGLSAKEAFAASRTTILGGTGSNTSWGIAAAVDVFDPTMFVPALNGTAHSVVGTSSASAPSPPSSANASGFGNSFVGVMGLSNSAVGVYGRSGSQAGVFGTSDSAYGVQGLSLNAFGVSGNSTTQAGVWGSSNTNTGVLGTSNSGVGVSGVSTSSNGVNGFSNTGIGVYGTTASGLAGRFDGNVLVNGNLIVTGTFSSSAASAGSDSTLRSTYGVAGAEKYYEDAGEGRLTNGIGIVMLDPDFVSLDIGDGYHVTLTPRGDCNGLFVAGQGRSGFEVRELRGGTSTIDFSYRVLARPKDGAPPRLDRVVVPPAPTPSKLDRLTPLDVGSAMRGRSNVPDGVGDGRGSGVPFPGASGPRDLP